MRPPQIKRFLVVAAAAAALLTTLVRAEAAGEVIFEDDFDSGLVLWTLSSGTWATANGRLEVGGSGVSELSTLETFSGDLIVEFSAAIVPPGHHDIRCRLFDSGYTLVLGAEFNTGAALVRNDRLVAWSDMTVEPGRTYAVRIMRCGRLVECLVDGALVLSWADTEPIDSGPITLGTWESKVAFDAIRVRRLPTTRQIVITDASTNRRLGPEAVATLRAARRQARWQVALAPASSRLEPTFAVRTPHGAYRVTFIGYPTDDLGEYGEHRWFDLHFAEQPALRVRLQDVDSRRTPEYAAAAGITTLPVETRATLFVDVAGVAARRTTGQLELSYGPAGGQPKLVTVQPVTLDTVSTPLLSHRLELKTEEPATYWVTAQLTVNEAVVARARAPFHVMAQEELLDAGNGFRLRRGGFVVDIDKRTGTIKGLFNAAEVYGTNYVANETNAADFALRDTRFVGDVVVTSRRRGAPWRRETTSCSRDVRRVSAHKGGVLVGYENKSEASTGGFQNVRLWERYGVEAASHTFTWDIVIENAASTPLEVGEIALPLLVNDTLFDLAGSRAMAYWQRVFAFPHAGGHSGFVLVERLSGDPPFLLIVPADGTAFEAVAPSQHPCYRARGAGWSGLQNVYLVSKATAEREHWKPGLNPPTSIALQPGEQRRLGVRMVWIDDLDELPAAMFRLGKVGLQAAPGMVVPTNQTASLLCWSKKPIRSVQPLDEGVEIVRSSTTDNASLHVLRFAGEGPKRVRLYTAPDEWTVAAFYAVPPIETLIDARARFIVERQHFRNPDDPFSRDDGFLPWDRAAQAVVQQVENPSAIIGCSDLGGFADPFFLAAKNVARPDKEQVRILEEYVEHCLFKHVQDPSTYLIRSSLYVGAEGAWPGEAGRDTSETQNYAFALNIYYDLYRIGTLYGLTTFKQPKQYLEMAANTAIAMFDNTRWHHDGQIGGGTVLDVLAALEHEGMHDKHADLSARVKACVESFDKTRVPYGGATLYAPTSYAQVYRFLRHFDLEGRAQQTLRAMVAARGTQPVWYQYANDRQWWHFAFYARQHELEEVGLFYSSAINGATLLDAYRRLGHRHLLMQGYAGVLAPWPSVGEAGDGSTGYHTAPWVREFDPLSTAGAVGLWGSLRGLGSYLVRDEHFGLLGFGCEVSASRGYTIIPKDGLSKRAYFQPIGVGVELDVGRLTKVAASENGTTLWVAFTVDQPFETRATITVSGLREGTYRLTANGETQQVPIDAPNVPLPPMTPKTDANLVVLERIAGEQVSD